MYANDTFLDGDLNEEIYMAMPPSSRSTIGTKVCKLKKSLYGLE